MDDLAMRLWVTRIDQILDRRQDRKGIIHTVSYARRDYLMAHSRHRSMMLSHTSANTSEVVNQFRLAKSPCVLVSPVITSGYDFPGAECDYIIIGKIPYPDTRSPLYQARTKTDSDWGAFLAMETIVQLSGRGTRSEEDKCEVLIVDDNWTWFWPRYKQFAPRWFHDRVIGTRTTIPEARKLA